MVVHAEGAARRPPEFPRHQRRRIRAGVVQGPRDHPPRSAQADRGRADRGLCDARARRLYLHSRRSEEHTSELQSLMRISYAVFCLKKKKKTNHTRKNETPITIKQ